MVRLKSMYGWPPEIKHLKPSERAALLEAVRKRNGSSTWGKWHRGLSACAVLLQFFLIVSICGPYGDSLLPDWGWLPLSVIILLIIFAPQSILMIVDAGFERGELEMLMLERGIRPAVCFRCRYDLKKSTSDTCPECGEAIAKSQTQAGPPRSRERLGVGSCSN